ncbi:MAG TPA: nucleotidyltransferase domain-containing protein [Candidatus Paceibacterota bacterium]
MNQATINFIEDLKKDRNVVGIILFGSWARGNNRPNSDVDLVVILKKGYKRVVEYREGQAFEVIYATNKDAFDFWESHRDEAAGQWEVAKILYDADGTIAELKERVEKVLSDGKQAINDTQKAQLRFDVEDTLSYVEQILSSDPTTAALLLTNKVITLTELFFDLRRIWIPAPKQRLAKIAENSPELHNLLVDFYNENSQFNQKLELVRRMLPVVFDVR